MTYGTEHLMIRRDRLLMEIATIRSEVAEINALLASMPEENADARLSLEGRLEDESDELEFVFRELEEVGKKLEELRNESSAASRAGRYTVVMRDGHFYLVGRGENGESARLWTYEEITAQTETTLTGIMGLEAKLGVYGLWKDLTLNFQDTEDYARICELISSTTGRKDIGDFLQGKTTPLKPDNKNQP
ncbi:MAG: hypothetical protein LBQ75_05175 [Zoogloeaceae bacterium]|jgi:hypothetical protein|nr:hypothetical protein [Zoogloeaceae bacterium]